MFKLSRSLAITIRDCTKLRRAAPIHLQLPLANATDAESVKYLEAVHKIETSQRDNDLETTKGNYTTIDGGVADSHFGSEADFGRMLIQNSTYYSIGRKRNSDRPDACQAAGGW